MHKKDYHRLAETRKKGWCNHRRPKKITLLILFVPFYARTTKFYYPGEHTIYTVVSYLRKTLLIVGSLTSVIYLLRAFVPGCLTAAHSGVRRRLSDSVYSVLAFRSSESRIIICFGQFLWKCYYLERMLEDNDGPQLLTESPVHNLRPGERVVSARSISYQLGKLLYALTSTLLCVGNDS